MVPPKKTVKMDLTSFLNDDTFGSSWAEEDVDLNKISIPIEKNNASSVPLADVAASKQFSKGSSGFGGRMSGLDPALGGGAPDGGRRDFQREEYPVPNSAPYRAIINNIPWDISPEGVTAWVEDGLNKTGAVIEMELPKSVRDPTRLKGIAFVTFKDRADLVQALTFNASKLNDRTVYLSVAAPKKGGYFSDGADIDWSSARGSQFQSGSGMGDGADLDWGAARGSNFKGSNSGFGREEGDVDWSKARGSNFKSEAPEADLDWGHAKGANFQNKGPSGGDRFPGRDMEEANLDWDHVRGSNFQAKGSFGDDKFPRRDSEEANLDWDHVRGANFHPKDSFGDEKYPRRDTEEADLDWGHVRGANFQEKQSSRGNGFFSDNKLSRTDKEEPELDWGHVMGANFHEKQEPRTNSNDKQARDRRRTDPELNWSNARGSQFDKPRQQTSTGGRNAGKSATPPPSSTTTRVNTINSSTSNTTKPEEKQKIQKSSYDILSTEDEDDEEEEEAVESKDSTATKIEIPVTELEEKTANLTVEDGSEWETVGKK